MSGSTDVVRPGLGAGDLWGLIRPARRVLILGCLVAVATALASLVQPLIVRALLEDVDSGGSVAAATVLLLVLMLVLETVLWGAGIYVAGRAASGLLRSVRVRLAVRLLRLRIVENDRLRSDDLISRLGNDTTRLGEALTSALMAIVPGAVLIVGSIAFMAVLDALLLSVTLAAVVVAGVLLWWLSPKVQEASEAAQEAVGELAVEAGRALRPLRTIKAARAEQLMAARLEARADDAFSRSLHVARLEALITPGTAMTFQGAYVLILAVGGARVASGDLSVPDFVAFLLYLFALTDPLSFTFAGVVDLQKGLGAARRVTDASRRDVEPTGPPSDPARGGSRRPVTVRFEAVSFAYRNERPVLRDVTIDVQAGSLTAIVGASGAGKTTMLALIERFYRPDSGRILLDALDIQKMALPDLRGQIGYVEQDSPVLDGSVRENVLLAQPEATPDTLASVIAEAGLGAVLDALPEGLETEVGEAGVLLSGGQRQRIAIARALVAGPPLLLLDEPTSQLDALTEAELRASLDQLRGRRTVIVVAHRLATVLGADQIIVLEDGRVRATGTHSHLAEHDPLYRSFCHSQNLAAPTH